MDSLEELRAAASKELVGNILPFAMRHVADREHGGFYGHVANDGSVRPQAPKALVQHSRMLWALAQVQRVLGDPEYARLADHARQAVLDWFWDAQHGGFFWMVDHLGRPLDTDKQAYGQAFAIYALAADCLATGAACSLERAIELYRLLEVHTRDREYGGYLEARHHDWSPAPELRVDPTSLPVVKSMNVHLHMMEAYATLLRAWDDSQLRARLAELVSIHQDRILNPRTGHLFLWFGRQWRPLSPRISYGHDIEASWLLVEAAEALGEPEVLAQARRTALQMAYATLEQGVDADGGLFCEGDPEGVTDRNKVWWPQAEAVVGFLNAYALNGDPCFLSAALAGWSFIQKHIVDREHGEWFWGVDEAGRPLRHEKAGPWKAAYHNGRACLQILARVPKLIQGA